MKKETWVVLPKDQLLQIASEQLKRGERMFLSAYDLPSKLHLLSDDSNVTIQFVYADSEPGRWQTPTEGVTILFGQYSNKVLTIKVSRDSLELTAVRKTVKKAPYQTSSSGEEKERLQRKTIDAVLDQNTDAIQGMALA